MIIKITKIKTGIRVKLTKVYHGIESFIETQYKNTVKPTNWNTLRLKKTAPFSQVFQFTRIHLI